MVLADHSGTSLHQKAMSKLTTPLTSNWTFANFRASSNPGKFLPARAPPTEIFTDLLAHGLIPDPFVGKNEREVQWVGEEDWVYRTIFETPEVARRKEKKGKKEGWKTELVLEGLDTFASVEVNGEVVAESNNMFLPLRVDVSKVLRERRKNELVIRFKSAFLEGKKRRETYPDFAWGCWNGDDSRLGVRKAQYHYVCFLFFPSYSD
jgi:beta-mannosidase